MTTNLVLWACLKENIDILKECIEMQYNLNEVNEWQTSPLIEAAWITNLNITKLLVDNGADINLVNLNSCTALGVRDSGDCVSLLKSKGARYLSRSTEGVSELAVEIFKSDNYIKTTKELINQHDQRLMTPFLWSIFHQRPNTFNYYLDLGADVNQVGPNRISPLMLAVFRSNLNFIEQLVKKRANVNHLDNNENSALCCGFDDKSITYLIENGAKVDLCGSIKGKTPLMIYTIDNNLTAFHYFINMGKEVDVNFIDADGNSILSYAILNKNLEMAYELIKRGANVNLCGPKGKTPLAWSVFINDVNIIKYLLDHGANVNQIDYQGKTALCYAQKYKYENIVAFLKENNAVELEDVSEPKNDIFLAIKNNNIRLVKQMLYNCFKRNEDNQTPLDMAIELENIKIIDLLLESKKILLDTALPTAIEKNNLKLLEYFLKKGANVNRVYKKTKQSPLLQAVNQKNKEIVELLLKYNANPNTKEKLSPLKRAIQLNLDDIVEMLIDKADLKQQGESESLVEMAINNNDIKSLICLLEHGADPTGSLSQLKVLAEEYDELDLILESLSVNLNEPSNSNANRQQSKANPNKTETNEDKTSSDSSDSD